MGWLFLGVDGVLHHCQAAKASDWFIRECMLNLRHIVQATGCMIVLTSSWRNDAKKVLQLNETLALHGIEPVRHFTRSHAPPDLTLPEQERLPLSIIRAREISEWRQEGEHRRLAPFAVLDDLVLSGFDGDELGKAPTPAAVAAATAHAVAMASRPRTVRIKRPSGKPFSNYQKYEAKTKALEGHTVHVTSVGPYVSKLEQMNLDEQDARARSIHPAVFKPGGLWDKYEAPPGGWGFAAAGFLLPDDLPETSKRFGSFYNTHAHQFRYTKPKMNLYM